MVRRLILKWNIYQHKLWADAIWAGCKREPARAIEALAIEEKIAYCEHKLKAMELQAGILRVAQ